jgi:hypothetical protein
LEIVGRLTNAGKRRTAAKVRAYLRAAVATAGIRGMADYRGWEPFEARRYIAEVGKVRGRRGPMSLASQCERLKLW